jgi:hypothetical protein
MSHLDDLRRYSWLISDDSAGLFPERSGVAPSITEAWSAAFAAGCAALLAGSIRHLAIAVND